MGGVFMDRVVRKVLFEEVTFKLRYQLIEGMRHSHLETI